jgi:hypothetical protein
LTLHAVVAAVVVFAFGVCSGEEGEGEGEEGGDGGGEFHG